MTLATSSFSVETLAIWLLIVFSIITWSLVILKVVLFYRLEQRNHRFLKTFWSANTLRGAITDGAHYIGPIANIAKAGIASIHIDHATTQGLAQEIDYQDRFERALRHQIQRESRVLESGLALVASIGSISPFVGLFGTVWGIMDALKSISASGSASLDVVAGPVGSALLATGVGIAVAIPAVLAHNYFLRRLKRILAELDDFAHDLYGIVQKNGFRLATDSLNA
ncbi:biopolymer transporter ExbB [Brenneria roseae subsp. americana]|uniref:Biopolymer transporter ExbB n=1 Tax=Brenneria roseae subsp. americana TaxID=1508507 RepID=A0A2U1TNB5_9GAMM|nr:MotA/TolQ/ExbB proton channel family protein [Brenneria roseae]PWC10896.1 biopolymer transporter ExbB [Brenneria roseae subsp. americana]